MWPGFIKLIHDYVLAARATDDSINVTLVGGAVGGQTVAQGDPNGGGADAWPVSSAQLPSSLGAKAPGSSLSVCLPSPTASAALTASTALPAAGAYESDPSSGAMVAVPAGSRRATITISYTRGASSGQAAHKIFTYDGTTVAQAMSPDGTYNGINGRASTGAGAIGYTIAIDLFGGETKVGIASAEIGVTGTPGTYASAVTFG
jgi:hypothetical protein